MRLAPFEQLPIVARRCIFVFTWFIFNFPLDSLGDTLVDNVQAYFTLGLRDSVMKSILSQDREYFDFHQVSRQPVRVECGLSCGVRFVRASCSVLF